MFVTTRKKKKRPEGRKNRCGACIGNKQACREKCVCSKYFPDDAMIAYKAGKIQSLFHRKGMVMLLSSYEPAAVSNCIDTLHKTCDLLIKDPVQGLFGLVEEAEKKVKNLEKELREVTRQTIQQLSTLHGNDNKVHEEEAKAGHDEEHAEE